MKKLLFLLLVLSLCICTVFAASAYEHEEFYQGAEKGEVINVFNWGEYISDTYEDGMLDVNREFEKLTGIKVNYVTFESNEDMYAKIKNGGASYDIVIPSDYMIERMVDENLLQTFDPTQLPNYHYIDSKYKNMYYDPDDTYSVPYNVGMVGLIYNTKMVDETPTSWKIMWDEKYAGKILMIDNPRDAFAIPQKILGYSFNSPDSKQLDDVAQMLIDQKPLLQGYVMDEVFNKMESGEAAMVPYYVGDYIIMKEINPDLAFVYPEEGVNIFVDAMCIPRTARNVDAALKYINFMLDPEIALTNAWYIGLDFDHRDRPAVWRKYVQYQEDEDVPTTAVFDANEQVGVKVVNLMMRAKVRDYQVRVKVSTYNDPAMLMRISSEVGAQGAL